MDSTLTSAIVAAIVSLIGIALSYIFSRRNLEREISTREEQWQESFRAELRRDLAKESSLRVMEVRLNIYGDIWRILKRTAGHSIRNSMNLKDDIQEMANELTDVAYSEAGLIMTDRSRTLLNHIREACGDFLKNKCEIDDVINRSHLFKHSLRSDLGIEDHRYESEMNRVANNLRRVDNWNEM